MADAVKRQANPAGAAFGIIGAIGGYALSQYSGMNLLIPGVSAVIVGVLLAKTVSPDRKPFVGAFAVQAGHLIWFLAAATFLGMYGPVIFDVIALAIGLTWLMVRPGLIPVLICGIYQGIGLVVNVPAIMQAPVGSAQNRALIVHIVFRLLAILLLITGLVATRKNMKQGAIVPSSSVDAGDNSGPAIAELNLDD